MSGALTYVVILALAFAYVGLGSGLVGSNDGSHVALARALAVHGRTSLEDEVGLTLWIDRAEYRGRAYSDRPPGTAFMALGTVLWGSWVDAHWRETSMERLRDTSAPPDPQRALVHRPATPAYTATYGKRRQQHPGRSPNLIDLQGTALAIEIHAAIVAALGLLGLTLLLRRRGVDARVEAIVVFTVGAGTLLGPYSTMLFSHGTATSALIGLMVGMEKSNPSGPRSSHVGWLLFAGACGALAVSADYALVLAVVPLVLLGAPWRAWWLLIVGAIPIAIATLWYHNAAFGSPLRIGYDYNASFEFARSRAATFGGNPLHGLWTLWGFGQGAGVLAQAPIIAVGIAGLRGRDRRLALAMLPWAIVLCFHRTPTGGAGTDHRYLLPAIPILGLGLAAVWQRALASRARTLVVVSLSLLTVVSTAMVWSRFFAWRI